MIIVALMLQRMQAPAACWVVGVLLFGGRYLAIWRSAHTNQPRHSRSPTAST